MSSQVPSRRMVRDARKAGVAIRRVIRLRGSGYLVEVVDRRTEAVSDAVAESPEQALSFLLFKARHSESV